MVYLVQRLESCFQEINTHLLRVLRRLSWKFFIFMALSRRENEQLYLDESLVVGKPLSMLLLNENATVTICHSRTASLPEVCREADILVTAIGKAKWVDERFVSEKTIVIDVGINVNAEGKLCGDVDYAAVEPIVDAITPVPGGVGSVTTSVLVGHVVEAAMRKVNA